MTSAGSDGFEFRRERVGAEELQSMSFADELFGNGIVKPLKLPPRLAMPELRVSSPTPRSSGGGLKLVFRQMWGDDSDPFQKAAEKVMEGEKLRKSRKSRRSGSVLPLGVHQWTINDLNMSTDFSNLEQESEAGARGQRQTNPMMINGIWEPRGLTIARKLRPLSMDQGMEVKKPMSPVKEIGPRLKGLLGCKVVKQGGETANKIEVNKRESKAVVQYKPRTNMLLCLGFANGR